MRISDWSSDVCSSDLNAAVQRRAGKRLRRPPRRRLHHDLDAVDAGIFLAPQGEESRRVVARHPVAHESCRHRETESAVARSGEGEGLQPATVSGFTDFRAQAPAYPAPLFDDRRLAVATTHLRLDRKSVVSGKRVSVRVDLGGRRLIKKKKKTIE